MLEDTAFNDGHDTPASATAEAIAALSLFGHRPCADEPDQRPLPSPEALEATVAGLFSILPDSLADTGLEDDLAGSNERPI